MKKTIALLSVVLISAAQLLVGCKSGTGGSVNWKSLEPMFEVASYTGTKIYLDENPGKTAVFTAVVGVLDSLIEDPEINVVKLTAALQALPIKELKDPKAALIVGSSLVVWNAYKDRIPLNVGGAEVLRPITVRIRNGIGQALGLDPIVTPTAELKERLSTPTAQLKLLMHH